MCTEDASNHKVQSYLKFLHVSACTLQTITVTIRISKFHSNMVPFRSVNGDIAIKSSKCDCYTIHCCTGRSISEDGTPKTKPLRGKMKCAQGCSEPTIRIFSDACEKHCNRTYNAEPIGCLHRPVPPAKRREWWWWWWGGGGGIRLIIGF